MSCAPVLSMITDQGPAKLARSIIQILYRARFTPVLPLLAVPAFWPFFASGLLSTSDGMSHIMRLGLLDHHIRQGTLFPRWLPELMLGRGYPLF
jgi:hypothetical protein